MKRILFSFEYAICAFGGLEGALISAALTGVSAIMQNNAAEKAAEKQQKIINEQLARESEAKKKKAQLIEDTAAEVYDPATRDAKYESLAAENEKSLVDSLAEANGASGAEVAQAAEGKLSGDYTRARAASTAAAASDIMRRAKLQARANAGGLMFQKEAGRMGELNSDIAALGSDVASQRRVSNAQLSGVHNEGSLAAGLMSALAPVAGAAANNYFGSSMQLPKGYDKLPKYEGGGSMMSGNPYATKGTTL